MNSHKRTSRNKNIQRLRFDGIYFAFRGDPEYLEVDGGRAKSIPASYFLKFYEDGVVIFAVISCTDVAKDIPPILRWFNRRWGEATTAQYRQEELQVQFQFDNQLVFAGEIQEDGSIHFRTRNTANGMEWEDLYVFWAE